VNWLAACIALRVVGAIGISHFSPALAKNLYWLFSSNVGGKFAQSSSQWEERMIPEELFQTLLSVDK
jgi:hypothetical protein